MPQGLILEWFGLGFFFYLKRRKGVVLPLPARFCSHIDTCTSHDKGIPVLQTGMGLDWERRSVSCRPATPFAEGQQTSVASVWEAG